jgi:hypothetical protein
MFNLVGNSWWTVVSPLVISAVLLKMTGIPLTEKTIVNTRPGYREYIMRTQKGKIMKLREKIGVNIRILSAVSSQGANHRL